MSRAFQQNTSLKVGREKTYNPLPIQISKSVLTPIPIIIVRQLTDSDEPLNNPKAPRYDSNKVGLITFDGKCTQYG